MRTQNKRTLKEISYNQNEALLIAVKNHLDDAADELKEQVQKEVIEILNIANEADNAEYSALDGLIDKIDAFIDDNLCDAHKCPYCGNWFFGDDDPEAGGLQWDEQNESCIYCTVTQNH